jgi:hypothetical protein
VTRASAPLVRRQAPDGVDLALEARKEGCARRRRELARVVGGVQQVGTDAAA